MSFVETLPRFIDGAWITVQVTVLSALLGAVLAVLAGIGMISRTTWMRILSRTYTEIFRGISALVLLFWVVFSLPLFTGIRLTEFTGAVIALGLNIGAYEAEVVRGAIRSIPRGQWEAGTALSMTPGQRMRRVIFPQAVAVMIPPWGTLTIQLLKASALVSLVNVTDLTFAVRRMQVNLGPESTVPLFSMLLVWYFVLSQFIAQGFNWMERRATVGRA